MRVLLRLAALLTTLSLAATAHAGQRSIPANELNAEASKIAGTPLEVRCWTTDADDPDDMPGAWGYVFIFDTTVYLSPKACAGALALVRGTMAPLWQLGLGALVLTHESYHLKASLPFYRRVNEAQTECRAVKRVPLTLLSLGATPALADAILPWSLAEHYRVSTIEGYNYPSCAVPVFKDFWK